MPPPTAASRTGVPAHAYRIVVSPHSDVCLPFAHAVEGDAVEIRFSIRDAHGTLVKTARYVATYDDPYGSGDLDDPMRNELPPAIFNDSDDDPTTPPEAQTLTTAERNVCPLSPSSTK